MSDSTHDANAAVQNRPPRVAATDNEDGVYNAVTGAAAASADIWAGYTADVAGLRTPQGLCWLELEAVASAAYVRFSRTATTTTTTSNGAVLNVGVPRTFLVDPAKDLFLDHIAAGVGVLKWRRVGPIVRRVRQ